MGQQIEEEIASKASRAESDPDILSNSEIDDTVLDEDYRPEKDDSPDNGNDTDTATSANQHPQRTIPLDPTLSCPIANYSQEIQ